MNLFDGLEESLFLSQTEKAEKAREAYNNDEEISALHSVYFDDDDSNNYYYDQCDFWDEELYDEKMEKRRRKMKKLKKKLKKLKKHVKRHDSDITNLNQRMAAGEKEITWLKHARKCKQKNMVREALDIDNPRERNAAVLELLENWREN